MLNVFALSAGAELVLRFPGPDNELICEYGYDPCQAALGMLVLGELAEQFAACMCHVGTRRSVGERLFVHVQVGADQ